MNNSNNQKPVVLVLAGHDPSGGAGIQADIESIARTGCHAATVITSLTSQNTSKVTNVIPQEPNRLEEQIELILEDMTIAACKIGLVSSLGVLDVIIKQLCTINIPVVLDPVLSATTGKTFADDDICKNMLTSLLPLTTLITPNSQEARVLTQLTSLNDAANKLLNYGTDSVLITGTHEETDTVTNTLYKHNDSPSEYHWERLPDSYHGSGCTLSSSIAAHLALGEDMNIAVEKAQEYTWQSLKYGLKLGHGQSQPDRFFNK